MRRSIVACGARAALAVLCIVGWSAAASAHVPPYMPVQGHLTDALGNPLTGTHSLTFTLYGAEVGGSALYGEEHSAVTFVEGRFVAHFGTGGDNATDAGADAGFAPGMPDFQGAAELWLDILVDNTDTIQPRLRLGSSPFLGYSLYCTDALSFGGKSASELSPVNHQATWGDISDIPPAIADGDHDALGPLLNCATGTSPKYGAQWECPAPAAPPAGMLAYVDGPCPAGWSEVAVGRALVGLAPGAANVGSTLGTALGNLENRQHTHAIDPPLTSTSSEADHSHVFTAPATTTSSAGAHSHTVGAGASINGWGSSFYTVSSEVHPHEIAANTGSHPHTLTLTPTSSSSDGAHSHSLNYPASVTAGATTGDVMPYVQLRICLKN